MRKRLYDNEAKHLNIEIKRHDKGRKQARYIITKEQWSEIEKLRSINNLSIIGKSTLSDANGNLVMEWVKTAKTKEDELKSLKTIIATLKEDITPKNQVNVTTEITNDKLCNQYTLTDAHLGLMAWGEESGSDWDMKIAEEILVNFFKKSIEISPNADSAIFAQIGDFIHWDGLDAVTPANKHVLDADTRFTKVVRVAIRVIRRIIKMLLEKYKKVTVIMAEGNHDPASSVWLREMLSSFYEEEPRLIIDTNPDPYYCITFGDSCLFYHHGHKRNLNTVDSVFVSKFKKEFGNAKFVYGHIGHLHNQQVKETNLMIIEQHRTLAAKDAYASRGGWSSGRDSKVITYHKEFGEVGRLTINIDMLK